MSKVSKRSLARICFPILLTACFLPVVAQARGFHARLISLAFLSLAKDAQIPGQLLAAARARRIPTEA